MGRRKYASVGTMDKGRRKMARGGAVNEGLIPVPKEVLDGKDFMAVVVDNKNGKYHMKFSKTYRGAMTMARNMTKKFDNQEFHVQKFDPYYGARFEKAGISIAPTKSLFPMEKGGCTSCGKRGRKMAHGGKTQGYNARLDESLSMRHGAGRKKEQGRKDRRDESEAMERSMRRRKYASVDTMDMGNRMMAHGGKTKTQAVRDIEKAKKKLIGQAKRKGISENFGQKEVRNLSDKYGSEGQEIRRLIDDFDSWAMDFDLSDLERFDSGGMMAHGGMHGQGYDDKLDESLAMRRGAGRTKQQSRKDRRDESAGMERSMGRRKYASVGTMDKGRRKMARGGRMSMQEREDIKKASEAMNDHLDKVGMSLRAFDESRPPSGVYRTMLGRYGWTDFDADVNSKKEFLFESDAIEDFTKYLKKAYPAGKKMAHGGMHRQGYDDKLDESLAMRRRCRTHQATKP